MNKSNIFLIKNEATFSPRLNKHGKVSILVPTYMERENVGTLVQLVQEGLSQYDFELVFIDDNSPDDTAEKVKDLATKIGNIKLISRDRKKGLGSAYKDGFKSASGEIIVEMDADLSHNPFELPKIINALNHFDIVVGSRHTKNGRTVGRRWHRNVISKGANLLAIIFLGLKVKDSTSGFRAYKRSVFEKVVACSNFNGFEFQVEALYIAKEMGYKIKEVPITFIERKQGRSKLNLKEIINFALALLKMRLNHGNEGFILNR